MHQNRFSRRYFFYGSLLAGAVPSGGFGSTPSLPALGYKSFNEKLNVAVIGLGGRGPTIMYGAAATENIVALCDVDDANAAPTYKAYPKATTYKDFRKLFDKEDKNIDAVMIATPDHWHASISLLAMQHGKHVYCEKPLTRTAWDSHLLAEAAAKYKVATQMGNQGFNHEALKTTCEILWSGEIGDVREVHAFTGAIYGGPPNLPDSGPDAKPVPDTLDWDLWLGPAEKRVFNPMINGHWRAFIDFSTGGSLGDWLVHCIGPAHLALRLDQASPISVECVKVEGTNKWVWPLRAHTVFEFPARGNMPPVTIHAYQNMRGDFQNPPGMAATDPLFPPMDNLAVDKNRPFPETGDGTMLVGDQLTVDGKPATPPRAPRAPMTPPPPDPNRAPGNGSVFVGSKGYMATVARGEGVWLLPASRWADYRLPPQVLQRGINHQQDWIRACKGGAPGVSNFATASKYIEWLALGTIALRVPGKLLWDAKNMRFTNSEEANKLLRPYTRKGWELKI